MVRAEVEDSLAASAFDAEDAGAGDKSGKLTPAEPTIAARICISWMKGMSRAASRGSPFAIAQSTCPQACLHGNASPHVEHTTRELPRRSG